MKKSYLLKAFGLIVLCFSLISAATTIQTNIHICPVGGEKFSATTLSSFTIFGRRLDLKPQGTYGTAPVPLVVCPNGFVDFKKNYSEEEIISFTSLINSTSYQNSRSGNTDYYMLAKILEHAGAPKLNIGWTYLEASWEVENKRSLKKYLQYLNLAIDNFNAAVDTGDREVGFTYRLLLVELNRLKGDFESAKLKLKELEANLTPVGYEKVVVNYEKELIDGRNSKPQSLPNN